MVPILMMGEKLELLPVFILLFLADAMGICFVSILRDQFVYDPNLPFPGAVMCTTAMDQIDTCLLYTSRNIVVFTNALEVV